MQSKHFIEIKNLTKLFPIQRGFWSKTTGHIQALNNVSFNIEKGQILGVVGESGCGKSTLAKLILRLMEPSSGEVYYQGENIFSLTSKDLRALRQKIQIVFQNPYSSLNPRMRIGEIISEPIFVHKIAKGKNLINERVNELLNLVGLEPFIQDKFPHEISGGQRQRVAIARALSLNPEFLVLDEPVSSLDVSIQAQILNLLLDLQKKLDLTYLFISHNLSVVSFISSHILVMYLGKVAEMGEKDKIIKNPQHPYTVALLSASPKLKTISANKIILTGEIPDPSNIPSGCVFRTRCPIVKDKCVHEIPVLCGNENHKTACYYSGELKLSI